MGVSTSRRTVVSASVLFVVLVVVISVVVSRDVLHAESRDGDITPAWSLEMQQAERPAGAATPSVTDDRPNVVLFLTDDMRTSDLRYMPKTRHLVGQRGVSFPNAISPHPLCCPARAELLTAQYAQNNHVYTNRPPYGAYLSLDRTRTTAVAMQRSGYRTGFTGKHLNRYGSYNDKPAPLDPGWDFWKPMVQGIYSYDQPRFYGAPLEPDAYATTDINDNAVEAIDQFSGPGQPFYLQVDHLAPHARSTDDADTPPLPEPKYADSFAGVRNPSEQNPNYLERNLSDKPKDLQPTGQDLDPASIQSYFLARIRSLQSVDDGVAEVIRKLKETGEYDNTYFIFTSDNGFSLGEHQYVGKNRLTHEILSVPLLISGPGIAPGSKNPDIVTTVDLAATVLAVTKSSTRGLLTIDGRSFANNRFAGRSTWRPATLIQVAKPARLTSSPRTIWDMRGVMTPRFTYGVRPGKKDVEILFDRLVDPWELHNKADDPRYADVKRVLAQVAGRLRTCSGIRSCNLSSSPRSDRFFLGARR